MNLVFPFLPHHALLSPAVFPFDLMRTERSARLCGTLALRVRAARLKDLLFDGAPVHLIHSHPHARQAIREDKNGGFFAGGRRVEAGGGAPHIRADTEIR